MSQATQTGTLANQIQLQPTPKPRWYILPWKVFLSIWTWNVWNLKMSTPKTCLASIVSTCEQQTVSGMMSRVGPPGLSFARRDLWQLAGERLFIAQSISWAKPDLCRTAPDIFYGSVRALSKPEHSSTKESCMWCYLVSVSTCVVPNFILISISPNTYFAVTDKHVNK